MNWLSLLFCIFGLLYVAYGLYKGFVRMALIMISMILVMALASVAHPVVNQILIERTGIYETIQEKTEEMINEQMADRGEEPDMAQQVAVIEDLPLPQSLKEVLLENNNPGGYASVMAGRFSEYLSGYIARLIMRGLAFLISFAVAFVIVRAIFMLADFLTAVPGLSLINRLAGGIFGAFVAMIWIYLFLALATILAGTAFGRTVLDQVSRSSYLTVFYNENLLWNLLAKLMSARIGL